MAHAEHGFLGEFKVFGVLPLTMLFGAAQYPLLLKYGVEKADE
jgi:intracellular septation protein A